MTYCSGVVSFVFCSGEELVAEVLLSQPHQRQVVLELQLPALLKVRVVQRQPLLTCPHLKMVIMSAMGAIPTMQQKHVVECMEWLAVYVGKC